VRELPSTYFVQDRKNKHELTRLTIQDRMLTAAMGGVLPEQPDTTVFRRVLDIGCGTGGWLIEAAKTYPAMSCVGIDISQRMIMYAQTQAEDHQVDDRVEFYGMDALEKLSFPDTSFDLVNLRLGISFLRTWDWRKMLGEMLRVTCPGGVVRVTDGGPVFQSNSPALTQLCEMALCAFFRAGHLFEKKSSGLTSHLAQLLDQYGCQQIQTKAHAIEYRAGTEEGEVFYADLRLVYQTMRPFVEKWGCARKDYGAVYHHALKEMCQPDFRVTLNLLTVWGSKPR
jgi:ubiquinone/menaquinone biosynthesis C-methylase UbiE